MAYPSNLMPMVGQQITLRADASPDAFDRAELMIARAEQGDCDLVVKGRVQGKQRGYVLSDGAFVPDRSSEPELSNEDLQGLLYGDSDGDAATEALTYLCVPRGSGWRVGIDRDADGFADGDELDAGSDPSSPTSTP
jgi:hypothetical protein